MKKIFLVARYELITMLTRRSFLLVAFGLPVIASLIFFGISLLQRSAPDVLADIVTGLMTQQVEGYVDQASVIKFLPEDVPPDTLIAFRDEAEARQALESGDIVAFYIIPEDFLDTGAGEYIRPGLDLFSAIAPPM